jgi:Flp pilus assembly pilin Flp
MNLLKERMLRPLADETGSQVTEFGIYAALVIAGAIVLLTPIGTAVVGAYNSIVGAL